MVRSGAGRIATSRGRSRGAHLDPSTDAPALVGIIEGEPGRFRVARALQMQAVSAERSIWIASAYFVPSYSEVEALNGAARDGVDVRVLVPSRYDHPWIRLLTRQFYRRLLMNGVRIWEWTGEMMHAKTTVTDGRWIRVGSTDFNPLGVAINFELDAVIEDPKTGAEAEAMFEADISLSREIRLARMTPGSTSTRSMTSTVSGDDRRASSCWRRSRARRRRSSTTCRSGTIPSSPLRSRRISRSRAHLVSDRFARVRRARRWSVRSGRSSTIREPLTLALGRPHRFMQTDIISLPLDPHGPLRILHDRIAQSGLVFGPVRFTFTPHVTLNLYRTLTADARRALLAVDLAEPAHLDRLTLSVADEAGRPATMLELRFRGR